MVFLPAFEEGIIPHGDTGDLEESRRVAFVAVTRAKHELYIELVGEAAVSVGRGSGHAAVPIYSGDGIMSKKRKKVPTLAAVKAAELEISANYLRGQIECDCPIGTFVQEVIDAALEEYRNAVSPG